MRESILEQIITSDNIPALPASAVRIIQLAENQETSADDLVKVIQDDPALTARTLKVVNSPLFGLPRQVSAIKQAVVIIGTRAIKVLALSFSLVDVMRRQSGGSFDHQNYWRRSLTTASSAKLLASLCMPKDADLAFTCGLLSDIGVLALWRAIPVQYSAVLLDLESSGETLVERECRLLGLHHAEVSRAMLAAWTLPEIICEAVGTHHGHGLDRIVERNRPLATVVACAAEVTELFCDPRMRYKLGPTLESCTQRLHIEPQALDELLHGLDKRVRETASTLSLPIGTTTDYAKLQLDALTRMAQLTMEAERERAAVARRANEAIKQAKEFEEERRVLIERADTDPLTAVPNRRFFDDYLEKELRNAAVTGTPVSLFMIDLDHFKSVNDRFGHPIGDQVLKAVARAFADVLSGRGILCRYGGEEFAVVLPGSALDMALRVAEELRRRVERLALRTEGDPLEVTCSFGVSSTERLRPPLLADDLIGTADKALYDAKRGGRNRVCTSSDLLCAGA